MADAVATTRMESGTRLPTVVTCVIAFLTVVDLFATQAILPTLVRAYRVTPAAMGVAVNASTIGMAISGLLVASFSRKLGRRSGVVASLIALSLPTLLLATMPSLAVFTALRIVQGLFMSAAFTLTLAYLAENVSAEDTTTAFAAYITGNVASNLFGRLMSAAVADHYGLAANFIVFAALNLAGAGLAFVALNRAQPMAPLSQSSVSPLAAMRIHLRNRPMLASFAIGFLILFAFIGTYTYVNYVLTREPIQLAPMSLGFVYLVFLPSIVTTPIAGRIAGRIGARPAMWAGLGLALLGLPLLLTGIFPLILAGLAVVGVGTFFAQATATGFVSQAATADRGAASGMYLASYFSGGLVGTAVLGQLFDRFGWTACVAGIAIALLIAMRLAAALRLNPNKERTT